MKTDFFVIWLVRGIMPMRVLVNMNYLIISLVLRPDTSVSGLIRLVQVYILINFKNIGSPSPTTSMAANLLRKSHSTKETYGASKY